tara:strand:- start:754 stop:1575 length:822 start_codon:yes stop_codon:yes gene_type:complete
MPRVARVSDIKANLLRPATTSHFEVEIPIIDALSKWRGVGKQDKIQLMCSEAVLPGSNLATFEINNDRTGVTEKHVHRRIFDDRIDLTFYVDAGLYQPIKFFEQWISYITNDGATDNELLQSNYDYRIKYPDSYMASSGLKVTKFEKDHQNLLQYEFIRVFPLAINSMPVSYDTSSLLKCTVSLSYVRYILKNLHKTAAYSQTTPRGQARFNAAGLVGGIVNSAVDRLTGNDLLGDIAGGFAEAALGDIPYVAPPDLMPPFQTPPRPRINPPG